jgi:hypothetical protein
MTLREQLKEKLAERERIAEAAAREVEILRRAIADLEHGENEQLGGFSLPDAIAIVLHRAAAPLAIKEIHARLAAHGLAATYQSVATTLRRERDKFARHAKGSYSLKKIALAGLIAAGIG